MSLGDKLSRLRKENNYTQEQLADILGVSRQAISKWESDVAYPETDKLIRLSALYRCSLDYLIKDDVDSPEPIHVQGSVMSVKANRLFSGMLRFAPLVLYALWALLLWAFYAAPLLKLSDNNLYQWFGKSVVEELQPTINALISLGVIAGAYIVALGVIQRFADRRINMIANVFSFALQAGVFVAAMSLIGVCKALGLEAGKVVVVTATLTGVFALLQAVFVALDRYFNHDEAKVAKPSKVKAVARKLRDFVKLHKALTIVIACVLVVGIAAAIVLPIVIPRGDDSPFDTDRVSRIFIGDSRDDVITILGEPLDVDTEKLAKVLGDEADAISKKNMYYYCSPSAEKIIKRVLALYDKVDELNSSRDVDDAQVILAQLNKIMEDLNDIEFQYIEVYFENGKVTGVEYDSRYSMETDGDLKWDERDSTKQKINFIPEKIPFNQTPYSIDLYAQIFYADGSYRLTKIEECVASGNENDGWSIAWNDHWGNYKVDDIKTNFNSYEVIESGRVNQNISYLIVESEDSYNRYTMKFYGSGSFEDNAQQQYPWSKYADYVKEIVIADGITNVPSYAFKNFKELRIIDLPNSIRSIGEGAFYDCSLRSVFLNDHVDSIGDYAFYGCSALESVQLPPAVRSIGEGTFRDCVSLTYIDLSFVDTVGERAFSGCTRLSDVTFRTLFNSTSFGEYAFAFCRSLTDVKLFTYEYSEGMFYDCLNLRTVENNTWSGYVYKIHDYAFYNCEKLESISEPGYQLSYVGMKAFYNCASLKEMDFSGVIYLLEIRPDAFYGCSALEKVIFYNNSNTEWLVKKNNYDDGITIWVRSPEDAASLLTGTYCSYYWYQKH